MRFFVDNNLSKQLANGMKAFGEEVEHLQDHFPEDAPDTDWLKYIGQESFFLITRDDAIRKNPAELKALKDYSVGAFFLGGKQRNRCQLIMQLVRNWPQIKDHAMKKSKPFAIRVPPSGAKFVQIDLR